MIECKICEKQFDKTILLVNHIKKSHNLTSKQYYDNYFNINGYEGFCKICNKATKFVSVSKGYQTYCSNSCATKGSEEQRKQTCIDRYGVGHPMHCKLIKDKLKEKIQEKYDVDYTFQSNEIKNKIIQTNLNKYGVEYSSQSIDFKNKLKKNCLEKYGVSSTAQLKEVRNKFRKTCIEKYGVDNPLKSKEVIKKRKETNLERYGFEYPLQSKEIRDKSRKTLIDKYNVDNPLKIKEVKEKISENKKEVMIQKLPKLLKNLNLEILESFDGAHVRHKWKCLKCNHKFEQLWNLIQQGYLCPKCYPRNQGFSKGEKEVLNFIKNLNFNVIENSRNIISPFELDVFVFGKNVGIEFDGIYYHSSKFNNNLNNHLNKTNLCKKKGIKLIHIFEDEWLFKKEIVKNRLKQILGVSNSIRVNARDCSIKEVVAKTKNEFLEKFHLQGKDSSKIKLGAFHNNELVSVMTFSYGSISKGSKTKKGIWELSRFCSNYNYHIPGIASKLLNYFKKNYEWKKIFSYADIRWSDGNLYYKLGFEYQYDTKPNYWYVSGFKRIHRFNLRKSENDPKGIPESILRLQEGYLRIWDCGNMKFQLVNN